VGVPGRSAIPDIDNYLYTIFHTGGSFQMFPQGDPEIERLCERQRAETDPRRRAEVVKDRQRYAATKFFTIPFPGQTLGFNLFQPWVGNRGVFNAWDDFAKAPGEPDLLVVRQGETAGLARLARC
jgi:ABC-type transport system substrate-binding protein